MVTTVLLPQDRPRGGWPAPGILAWQGDGCSLRKASSDLSELLHAYGGYNLPEDMVLYGSHIISEEHFFYATRKLNLGLSTYSNGKHSTARTRHFPPQLRHWSEQDIWGAQSCRSGSAICLQTITKGRTYENTGQAICRSPSGCLLGRKSKESFRDEPPACRSASLARANSLMHSPQRPKSSKVSPHRTNTGQRERLTLSIAFAPVHNKLANKACQPSTVSGKDFHKDHCDAEPFDPLIASASSTPLAVKRCSQEGFQSAYSLVPAMNERWAGPAFANSPPPSSLPVPLFTRRQSRSSFDIL